MSEEHIDPTWLVVAGMLFSVVGAILLACDALGAPEFIAAIDQANDPTKARTARLGFIVTINNAGVATLSSVLILVALSLSNRRIDPVLLLVIAPAFYFGWRTVAHVAGWLHKLMTWIGTLLAKKGARERIGCVLHPVLALLWIVAMIVPFLGYMVLNFGIDVPLRAVSEYAVAPVVLRAVRRIAQRVQSDRKWLLRRYAVYGTLWLLLGFVYQLIGTLLYLLRSKSGCSPLA